MLAAMVAAAGGEPWLLPVAADTAASLDAALAHALEADLLLISGGVSAGKFDLVEPALARAGARFHFTGVRIQTGQAAGLCGTTLQARKLAPKREPREALLWAAGESGLLGGHLSALCRASADGARR